MKQTTSVISLLVLLVLSSCTSKPKPEDPQTGSSIDSIKYFGDQAQSFYESGDLEVSREMYLKMLEFENPNPRRLKDVILMKRLFFVPDTFQVPGGLIHEQFVIKPLKAIHAEMDYQAVMSSVDHLTGVIGRRDWPGELTLEEDRAALAGHEWEFENRTGFVYTVLNKSESEVIGCVYIYPSRLDEYDTEIVLWVTEKEFERGMEKILFNALAEWLDKAWPFEHILYPGREISWGDFFATLDKQDEQYL